MRLRLIYLFLRSFELFLVIVVDRFELLVQVCYLFVQVSYLQDVRLQFLDLLFHGLCLPASRFNGRCDLICSLPTLLVKLAVVLRELPERLP